MVRLIPNSSLHEKGSSVSEKRFFEGEILRQIFSIEYASITDWNWDLIHRSAHLQRRIWHWHQETQTVFQFKDYHTGLFWAAANWVCRRICLRRMEGSPMGNGGILQNKRCVWSWLPGPIDHEPDHKNNNHHDIHNDKTWRFDSKIRISLLIILTFHTPFEPDPVSKKPPEIWQV